MLLSCPELIIKKKKNNLLILCTGNVQHLAKYRAGARGHDCKLRRYVHKDNLFNVKNRQKRRETLLVVDAGSR